MGANPMKHLLRHITLFVVLITLLVSVPPVARSAAREVFSTADSGAGTLRQALLDANPGDIITFSLSVFPPNAPKAILVRSALPTLSRNTVTIDASNAGVVVDGSQAPASTNGLVIRGDGCVIMGLTIQNFKSNGIIIEADALDNRAAGNRIGGDRSLGDGPNGQGNLIVANVDSGIDIRGVGATGTAVYGNYIGIEQSGRFDQGNARSGVAIWQGSSSNVIGGATPGQRNVISGNTHNGVWIEGNTTSLNIVQGNYIGTTADGSAPVGNSLAGVAIQGGASSNTIGGTASGAGNLISGNLSNGIYISDLGTRFNQVLGNTIGLNSPGTAIIGQKFNGVILTNGATNTTIGSSAPGGRNIIGGSEHSGVLIQGVNSANNTVQGNYIGSNAAGTAALGNGLHGVELKNGTHHNTIGGNRSLGEGNLLSGNLNHGLVIHFYSHDNIASGNLIGPDATGSYSLGNQPFGGVDIAEGAYNNTIVDNVISGNRTDGIALFDTTGDGTNDNKVVGNIVGRTLTGDNPLPNQGTGIASLYGARRTLIQGNVVAYNQGHGIWVAPCSGISVGNIIRQNSIYSNTLGGILSSCEIPAPSIKVSTIGATETVTGRTLAGARVEIFSDDNGQGRVFEDVVQADSQGNFTLSKPGGFVGPNITATSTDGNGNTSGFSAPAHVLWTLLLYFNGDNDLGQIMFDTIDSIAASGPSPRANVLALVDGPPSLDGIQSPYARTGTALYNLSYGQVHDLDSGGVITSEMNMGSGQTLASYVTWARSNFPARHTMLSIMDHGGGWAPSSAEYITGSLPYRRNWFAGGSGLSWDFTSNYDYLDSNEISATLKLITNSGSSKLDVIFYDVCLMGMLEVAHQITGYADYFVSSQNIGWAPDGPDNRYVRMIQNIAPTATPLQIAKLVVDSYADTLPVIGHPFSIAAVDMAKLQGPTGVVAAANQLALAVSQRVTNPTTAEILKNAYLESQKIDYDSDFQIETTTDGFVDLYDFAQKVSQRFNNPVVTAAANAVVTALGAAIVAERHRNGSPWFDSSRVWTFDNLHGLSVFLPLGEDLELVVSDTVSLAPQPTATRLVPLRDTYTSGELRFVGDTAWGTLINAYYNIVAVPTSTTNGPVDGLVATDITPPRTTIAVAGAFAVGEQISITWSGEDLQTNVDGATIPGSGVNGATLWYQPPGINRPSEVVSTQGGTAGVFLFTLSERGCNTFAVLAIDKVGNVEPFHGSNNTFVVRTADQLCPAYLPAIRR
jgi:hypothetical protein